METDLRPYVELQHSESRLAGMRWAAPLGENFLDCMESILGFMADTGKATISIDTVAPQTCKGGNPSCLIVRWAKSIE